tara:strand:- start:836 stop:1600 length:765 start_codon:yes stop_codon:yes gene_type:complete
MKLGIIQGRLSEPKEGFQECPVNWKREFDLLPKLGLNHIEWIITYENFSTNPIFTQDLKQYPISSVCADFMVSDDFNESTYINEFLKITCEYAIQNEIKNVTIPLLEKSSIDDNDVADKFIDVFYPHIVRFKDLNFLIEAELNHKKLKKVLDLNSNLFVTYDTGNITSHGLSHKDYILELGDRIKQVHIKDRTRNPLKTVEPNTGDTDFKLIFEYLNKINYDGIYTLQTARGIAGKEIETIKRHKKIIKGIYND